MNEHHECVWKPAISFLMLANISSPSFKRFICFNPFLISKYVHMQLSYKDLEYANVLLGNFVHTMDMGQPKI